MEAKTFYSHLELKLSLKNIEPLILVMMQVSCRATPGKEGVLQNERVMRVRRTHLEGNGADAQSATLAFSISASRNSQCCRYVS